MSPTKKERRKNMSKRCDGRVFAAIFCKCQLYLVCVFLLLLWNDYVLLDSLVLQALERPFEIIVVESYKKRATKNVSKDAMEELFCYFSQMPILPCVYVFCQYGMTIFVRSSKVIVQPKNPTVLAFLCIFVYYRLFVD